MRSKVFYIIFLFIVLGQPAFAYIDPGTGSMLFTIVISLTSVLFFFANTLFEKLKLFIFKDKSNAVAKPIVIYTEHKRYYNVFKDIVDGLEACECPVVVYVTSEDDPFLQTEYKFVKVENIGKGYKAYSKLAFMNADVCLMTTPHLDVFQLKRSKKVKHYSYLPHEISDCCQYRLFGLDYFDSVLLCCDANKAYIREIESKRKLPNKELVTVGSPKLDFLQKNIIHIPRDNDKFTILFAPTWGDSSILANLGEEIFEQLSKKTDWNIIFRPHPQSFIVEKDRINKLMDKYKNCPNITLDDSENNLLSMAKADFMITDFSGISFEFTFLFNKPIMYSIADKNEEIYDVSILDNPTWKTDALNKIGNEITKDNVGALISIIDDTFVSAKIEDVKNYIWQEQGNGAQNVVNFLINKQKEVSKC